MPDNHSASAPAAPNEIRESTCIHTKKIYDSCQAKDCVEDLRLYPLLSCQSTIDSAMSLRAGRAELLHVYMDVQPVGLGRGYYAVDLRFFYKVTAEATAGCARSALVTGLAIFDKRSMLFGSEGRAKRFTSDCACQQLEHTLPEPESLPTAVCEAVDPLILSLRLVDCCAQPNCCDLPVSDIPAGILNAFDGEINFSDNSAKRIYCSLGQFSILYMERDAQLLIPMYDYCMPTRECAGGDEDGDEDPCEIFRQIRFPVGEFFPPSTLPGMEEEPGGASCSHNSCC